MKRVEWRRGIESVYVGIVMRGEGKREESERAKKGGEEESREMGGREWVKERVEEGRGSVSYMWQSQMEY